MRRVTKKTIVGFCVVACMVTVASGIWGHVPLWAILKRAVIAMGLFGVVGFAGGLLYEKVWLR